MSDVSVRRRAKFPQSVFCQSIRQNSTTLSLESSRKYCQNLLRKHDYPSYLQMPFFPSSARDAHLAISALNVEMAIIPEIVNNQHARIMRMQFWKDSINLCFEERPKAEPVSIVLAHALANGVVITKDHFQSIIEERVCPFHGPLKTTVVKEYGSTALSYYRCPGNTPF